MNNVQLSGNLSRDLEIKKISNGTIIVKGCIANNRNYGEKKETIYVDFTMWGKTAEAFAKFHKKGSFALLEGRLSFDTWEDRTSGQKRSKLYLTAEKWHFTGNKKSDAGSEVDQPVGDAEVPF